MGCFFFFNDTATTEIYTLSLHDALPILPLVKRRTITYGNSAQADLEISETACERASSSFRLRFRDADLGRKLLEARRSEEHTSELQSQSNLVCRLLLE